MNFRNLILFFHAKAQWLKEEKDPSFSLQDGWLVSAFVASLFFLFSNTAFAQFTFPVNGVADEKHTEYAFINAKIYTDYKTMIDSSVLLVKDGIIEAVGNTVSIPKDAVVIDLKGKYIYPSFLDMYSDYGMPEVKKDKGGDDRGPQFLSNTKGAYNWNQAIKPEINAVSMFDANEKKADELRKLGFGMVLSQKRDGIARGTGTVVLLADEKENKLIVKDKASAGYSFDKGSSTQDYPSSLMGAIALLRQTYYDARWYANGGDRKEFNISLDAWNKTQSLPQIFEVTDKYSVLRASKIADEFGVKYIIKSAGDEYQRIDEIKETKNPFIIPLNFPQPFDVDDPYDAMQISLGEMKHWELAPYNPAMLEKAGIEFALTTSDLKDKKDFRQNLLKAIQYGLSEEAALKSLTTVPSGLLKVSDKTGSLQKGMIANFLITSKKIFDKESVLFENWVAGKQYKINDVNQKDVRGTFELTMGNFNPIPLKSAGDLMEPTLIITEDTTKVKGNISRSGNTINISFEFTKKDPKGVYRLNGNVLDNGDWKGSGQLPDGSWTSWYAKFLTAFVPDSKKDSAKKEKAVPGFVTYPNRAYGWKNAPVANPTLIKNITVWTNEKDGILKNTDVLIEDGKIVKIGKGLDTVIEFDSSKIGTKKKIDIIDGTGKHLSAGIIDEHSHIAISRGVNEGTQSVTSEVRIGDVVNPDDVNIYRNLSGGVTSSHLLHGSANAIGGQTQLIKLRWGSSPEKMKFEGADGFIKFALGENVKQSNWGDKQTVRFPQTRMGVEQVYVDAFQRAKEYEALWKKFNEDSLKLRNPGSAPRRDLELDALVEIMNQKRFITCHSYQQGEINMLMHVADSMGFKVNTFTHILEGYKVADKMKKHGAGGSSFADWWAYKYEVVEAIPYNGAIMHDVGVTVAFNSDDAEMARRLNQEAAKAVKYGNVSEEEALKFVTLNPAILLHVDKRVGSIKEGKDADLVVWNDNPLSIYAKPEKTFVDGVLYYDLESDKLLRNDIRNEKARLVKKMMDAKKNGEKTQKAAKTDEELYHCDTILPSY